MAEQVKINIQRLNGNEDLPLPKYMSDGASGMDMYAAVTDSAVISAGEVALIPTGIRIAMPEGFEAQIRPRSGLAIRSGIGLLNSPGTIDADYRGELGVILFNTGETSFEVQRGDRIAQLVVAPVATVHVVEAETLPDSRRGVAGFGSTGIGAG